MDTKLVKRVYIAGKLADDAPGYNANRKRMIQTALEVSRYGFAVFVPCLDDVLALSDLANDWGYERYFNNSQPWLEVSDAIFLTPGWKGSKGTEKEIYKASELGIPVFEDLNALVEYFENKEKHDKQLEETLDTLTNDGGTFDAFDFYAEHYDHYFEGELFTTVDPDE